MDCVQENKSEPRYSNDIDSLEQNVSIQSTAVRYYSHPVIPPLDEIENEAEVDHSTDICQ